MTTQDDLQREIDRVQKRTRRYWLEDGLTEIITGSGFLLVALYFLLLLVLQGQGRAALLKVGFPVVVIVAAVGGRVAIRLAKDRYVHPRTGYISLAQPRRHRAANAVLGFVIAALIALLASRTRALDEWIPALTGLSIAAGFLIIGRQAGMLRFPLAGLSCAVLGVVLSLLHLAENVAAAVLFGWLAVVLIAGGSVAFSAYIRHVPPREDA